MIDIIQEQRKPSFSERLNVGVGRGIEGAEQLYNKHLDTKFNKRFQDQFGIDPTGLDQQSRNKLFSDLVLEREKKKLPAFPGMGGPGAQGEGGAGGGFDFEGMSEEQKATMAHSMPKAYKALKESSEKKELTKGITNSLDWLEKNIGLSGKFGVHPGAGGIEAQGTGGGLGLKNPETGKQMTDQEIKGLREEIDKVGIWTADNVYTHFNKGVLNKDKWEDVKGSFAPNSNLPAKVNRARMAAMKRIMGLPENAPSSVVNKVIDKEAKSLEKIQKSGGKGQPESKVLTEAVIKKYMKEANGDPDAAAALAQEAGYTW